MADISYTRTTWADGQEGGTAIDATKLNNIEQGIVDAVAAIGPNDTTVDGTLKAQIDQNTSDISNLQASVAFSTGSVTYESGYKSFESGYSLVKIGHLVIFTGSAAPNSGYFTAQYPKVATLPVGWRPSNKVAAPCSIVGTGWAQNNNGNGMVRIDDDGSVRMYFTSSYTQAVGCVWCITYLVS